VKIGSSRDGALVTAVVRPRSRPGLEATDAGLVIGVAAAPVEGKATEEARRALAAALGVAPSTVSLRRGERSRTKVFLVLGLGSNEVKARLERFG
jgi:uncharacterized protein YggU (UPF0235/DUF167 family)